MLNVLGVGVDLAGIIHESVGSQANDFGDDEESFPGRRQLVHVLGGLDPS